jgi:hypothetical protein
MCFECEEAFISLRIHQMNYLIIPLAFLNPRCCDAFWTHNPPFWFTFWQCKMNFCKAQHNHANCVLCLHSIIFEGSKLNRHINFCSMLMPKQTRSFMFRITVCSVYDAAIKAENRPHVVLDLTMSGVPSETAKSVAAALALPTISTSFGQEGDLRWDLEHVPRRGTAPVAMFRCGLIQRNILPHKTTAADCCCCYYHYYY